MEIFREVELDKVAASLEQGQKQLLIKEEFALRPGDYIVKEIGAVGHLCSNVYNVPNYQTHQRGLKAVSPLVAYFNTNMYILIQ